VGLAAVQYEELRPAFTPRVVPPRFVRGRPAASHVYPCVVPCG
jgi:hypothetical protein